MELRFRARKTLSHAEHAALQRGARELAESRTWWCGAPVVFVNDDRRLECWIAVCFDPSDPEDVAMGAQDVELVCDFLRASAPPGLAWDVQRHATSDGSTSWGFGSRGLATSIAHAARVRGAVRLEREPESVALRDEIARERRQGTVRLGRFRFEPAGSDARMDAIDRAALVLDLRVLGPTWERITQERARFLFEALLRADLAYRSPLVDEARARAFAARFFDGLDASASYVTNGTWDDAFCGGSSPIGDATFDVAVGAAGDTHVALMWVGDED